MKIQANGREWVRHGVHVALGFALSFGTITSALAAVEIAEKPLAAAPTIEPNIMFVLDDSGSMHFEYMPEENSGGAAFTPFVYPQPRGVYGGGDYTVSCGDQRRYYVPTFADDNFHNVWLRSAHNNKVYYNPNVTYTAWSESDGSKMANADPANALYNPSLPAIGGMNLTQKQTKRSHWYWGTSTGVQSYSCNAEHSFWPVTYFTLKAGGDPLDIDDYDKVEITTTTAASARFSYVGPDGTTASRSKAEEIQNFANWFQYYRSRILAARAGIGEAFAAQGKNRRVGFGTINKSSSVVDGVETRTIIDGVRRFEGAARENFFSKLYDRTIPNSGTPLRRALGDAGEYYARSDNAGPWGKLPGNNDTTSHVECRQSFTILMTDGYWSGDAASQEGARENTDGSSSGNPTITGPGDQSFTYAPVDPFEDNHSSTLADVAMYYWKRDLRTNMENRVPTGPKNPAFWQHMVTMGIGLGVTGSVELDSEAVQAAIANETAVAWPDPTSSDPAKIDDLLHASINGRGEFVNAANPDTFATKFLALLNEAGSRAAQSASAAAINSSSLQDDSMSFVAGFRSDDWSGTLKAFELDDRGVPSKIPSWDAEVMLNRMLPGERNILTHNGSAAVDLGLTNLSAAQVSALNVNPANVIDGLAEARIAWLRGVNDHNALRRRPKIAEEDEAEAEDIRLLGDIVSSNPQYAPKVPLGYTQLPGIGEAYRDYRASTVYNNRVDALYVGANSGMLHGFDSTTGAELFAYMPGELFRPEAGQNHARISQLMGKDSSYHYFMDGTPVVSDAYIDGSWRTVLVSSMGLGGRTIFAIDVTDPAAVEASDILWEFTDPDMGYGIGQPAVMPLRDGRWVAVFGNGYNSAGHDAVLYVVNLADGSLIKKIIAGAGTATTPNGLSGPYVTDWPNGGRILDRAYAGDLQGNLWRFDLSDTDVSDWTKELLFRATDQTGNRQPITTPPAGAPVPGKPGTLVVSFGTGSFFRTGDDIDNQVQSLYGVFDTGGTSISRSDLVEQVIETQASVTVGLIEGGSKSYKVRRISERTIESSRKGWYMDLEFDSTNTGERVISGPTLPGGLDPSRIRFTTLIPDSQPCTAGRGGYIMDFLLATGGRTPASVFDLNLDKKFDHRDRVVDDVINGISEGDGTKLSTIRQDDRDCVVGGQLCLRGEGSSGRQTWEQLR
ncbi:pilus assembly protein [Hydrocarboniclastica marina]|uniref:Pilus assembly protein PilY n=1 Tax=Hydrocarboniclastica marina TaxID=2259620 RepID=A0A4P7XH46_9ALTE|nr:PilC/PilY family type IV pilus protein [Hydrocarboniclastica marina]QCF25107.1 pilus assembly protein PilY [Hydrocarboniclastica marina]